MHEALLRSSHSVVNADDFSLLSYAERTALRGDLACPSCRADAYFIREARNGRRACFGARPHDEDCELASLATEDGGSAALDETDERINAGDVFRLEPNRARAIRHVEHDPTRPPGSGNAVRYTRTGSGYRRVSSLSMDRLLRQLALRPAFRTSRTMLELPDGSRGTVRTVCKHANDVTERDLGKRNRIYWGTILFPAMRDDGGAWLNTGSRRTLTVTIGSENLELLAEAKDLEYIDDLSGSFFAYAGPLRRGPSGKFLVFADDLEWLAVRPFDQDAELN